MAKKMLLISGIGGLIICLTFALDRVAAFSQSPQPLTSVPKFKVDPMWPKPLPNRWTTGAIPGIAVDSHDHIWVLQRPKTIADHEKAASLKPPTAECCIPAPPVLEFDMDGNLLQAWGGPGQGYEWPQTEHGLFVDYKGNVWISGGGEADTQILKFTSNGKFILQIGHNGKHTGSDDTEDLAQPSDMFVYPKTNELFVADGETNQHRRIIVFDADTGAYKRLWGAYGKKPVDVKNPPRDQIIQGTPPTFFNAVHDVVVSNDGLVYVADRANNRIQVFKLDGTFIKEAFVKRDTLDVEGTVYGFAFSPDREQKFLYVADGPNMSVHILNRQTLKILDSFGGHGGHMAQEFFHLHSIAASTDSKGNIYLGEVGNGQRYLRYTFRGMGAPSNPGQ